LKQNLRFSFLVIENNQRIAEIKMDSTLLSTRPALHVDDFQACEDSFIASRKEEISKKKNFLLESLKVLQLKKEEITELSNEYVIFLQKTKTRLAVKEHRTTIYMIQKLDTEIKNTNLKIQTLEKESENL